MITTTYAQLLTAMQVLRGTPQEPGLATRQGLDPVHGFVPLRRVLRAAEGHMKDFDEGRERLLEPYEDAEEAQADEDFREQWIALLNSEVKIDAAPVAPEAFADVECSFAELDALGPILKED